MNFQRIILICAIVLLIICLILIGMVLVNSKSTQQWPPLIGDCPDYWVDMSGNGSQCVNIKGLGTWVNTDTMNVHKYQTVDFSISPYTGSSGTCEKYKWANENKVTWDGITYGVPSPCDTTTTV
jgi:hypothetical protein